jgi:large subunit ribosomal protein L15
MTKQRVEGLESLTPARGALKAKRRIGRGPGSGRGKTAGRGEKGAKSRSGYSLRRGFEGGQMPLVRRLPKRGFTNKFGKNVETVNLRDLERFPEGSIVTPTLLAQQGIIRKKFDSIKVLGKGEIAKRLVVQANAFSAGARAKIEAAGGKAEEIEAST